MRFSTTRNHKNTQSVSTATSSRRLCEREKWRKWISENQQVRLHNRWLIENFSWSRFPFYSCHTPALPTLLIHFPLFSEVESLSQLLVEKCTGMLHIQWRMTKNKKKKRKPKTYDSLANMIFTNSIPWKRVISFSISKQYMNAAAQLTHIVQCSVCCVRCHLSEESFRSNAASW